MSKISQKNKELKTVGKVRGPKAKTPKADEAVPAGKCPNYGKCITCKHYPKHIHGEAQPCKTLGKYVARKAEHPECYKCKFD